MAKKNENTHQFKLRLPSDLAEKIKKSAAENERTINAEIIYRLKNS